MSEASDEKLVNIFQDGLKLYEELIKKRDSSTDSELEEDVKKCMKKFESATQLVSAAALFSSNESLEDLSTETIKYLLLPAFLGLLTLRLVTGSRREIVEVARIYLRDYIKRCNEYSITDVDFPLHDDEKQENGNKTDASLTAQMSAREEKIKRYTKEKELNAKVGKLKSVMESENVDETSKREYFMTLIELHIMKALEELQSIKSEIPLIEMMEQAKIRREGKEEEAKPKKPAPKLQPFIITKNDLQKAVFGQGYPSVPVYTVDEFYEQRVKDGSFPGSQCKTSNVYKINPDDNVESNEQEDVDKEKLLEDDDPVALQRARNMDEFRDDHKRGEGNRYNAS